MSTPLVPPRPQRAQAGPTAVTQAMPPIPPRPVRKTDPSPSRDAATRSPLNEPPTAMSNSSRGLYANNNSSGTELRRPPSVTSLPSIGQEGSEYASFDQLPPGAHGVRVKEPPIDTSTTVQQTRHADVPMLAPTASIPISTAKSRISAVTRTDSSQAAAAGIGKARPEDDLSKSLGDTSPTLSRMVTRGEDNDQLRPVSSREAHPLRGKTSFSQSSTSLVSNGRPASVHSQSDLEHGIPEIGIRVPMYPNAGDVQAPSPAPGQTQFPSGIGFFNDGSTRSHFRKRSSRQEFAPPGSYGLHGHPGQEPGDQFEKQWIAKHPDIAAREGYGVYGGLQPRPSTALSSEQLNRLVREGDDIGMGTDRRAIGTPDQEIGYLASAEYAARFGTPKTSPAIAIEQKKRSSSDNPTAVGSPLRKASLPFNHAGNEQALDTDDDQVIHIDPPARRYSKVTGGGEADGAIDLGPHGGNTHEEGGWFDERGSGTPIMASDEIIKRPGSAYLQPAVSPELERGDDEMPTSRRGSLQYQSRPSSRPSSIHGHHQFGGPLSRFISHEEHHGSGMGTPLEEIEEYEPLFPEDEIKRKIVTEKLKRKGLEPHHFPSQDIWEDTPPSLQFTTNVDTPEPQREALAAAPKAAAVFETPEQEQARRTQNPDDMTSDKKTFAKPHFKGVQHDMDRPGVQRFPSQDIWEDTPDSMRLVTTVSSPQVEDVKSPPDERPTTSAIPKSQDDAGARATTGLLPLMTPQAASRSAQRSKLSQEITPEAQAEDPRQQEVADLGATKTKAPSIPDRPKPSIPARPAKQPQSEQSESLSSSPPKSKPAVPARPAGNKISGLRASFMNDLNSRLQIGPQASQPKAAEPEPEAVAEEKAPLADARKGRAKGPARRKPAASPSAPASSLSFAPTLTIWSIGETNELEVPSSGTNDVAALAQALAANEAHNLEASAEPVAAAVLSGHVPEHIGAAGDVPDPTISTAAASEQKAVEPELEQSLAAAEPAPSSAEELQSKDAVRAAEQHTNPLPQKAAEHVSAKASEEGSVAIRDGEEVANAAD